MAEFEIECHENETDAASRARLYDLLGEDNTRRTGRVARAGFSVLLRDAETAAVIGGLCGVDDFGWGFIDLLFVPEVLRGGRLGARLVGEAEAIARRRGMIGIWVNTYDFQARGFYEKLGYTVFAELEGGATAAGQFFLRKRF